MAIIRPPFTGIHEVLPNSGGNVPHEGGGQLPPYGEDPFQRIVDLNFGGGVGAVFASGDVCCYLRTATIPEPSLEQTWKGLTSLMFSDGGAQIGSSYANVKGRPTFLMCGDGNNSTDDDADFGGIIALSHDGTNWKTVFFDTNNGNVTDLVWDPRTEAFYARSFDLVWVSHTGYDWALTSDNFYSHCPHGISDGTLGFDEATGTVIFPEDVPGMVAQCTAFAGGIWLAGGVSLDWIYGVNRSCTSASIDGGKTWQIVTAGPMGMTGDYAVTCISGGPMEDFQ